MKPHLTLTLSPPIGWERRGNSRRTPIVPREFAEQRQARGSNAQVAVGGTLPMNPHLTLTLSPPIG
ncbi:MAG: hypothetical protein ABSG04_06410, partial [Verrucomicrobiota bacterium]